MKITRDVRMSKYLWYKIGGPAKYLLECSSREDIIDAVRYIQENKIQKYFVVGLGSNLLFTDDYYDGAVIRIVAPESNQIKLEKNIVEAFAGVELDSVIQFCFENNLVGLEWAGGLPGTVGAAVRGNVGAFGSEIKESFAGAEVLTISNFKFKISNLNRRDIKFGYRMSTVKKNHNMIVLSAKFELKKVDALQMGRAKQTYLANIEHRKNRHPLDFPSNGSAFKNISSLNEIKKILEIYPDLEEMIRIKWHGKASVGYLIKELGLSGYKVGGAQISHKHSNFIVNLGGATFTDVMTIIKTVQDRFQEVFGFMPEPEVEIVE